jgi:hypothetical protein
VSAPPSEVRPDGHGVTVCMHIGDYMTTNASMVVELPANRDAPLRAWVAVGSPCVSVYVPVFPPTAVPGALARPDTWARFAALRRRVEADGAALADVRQVLAPLETELWEEADALEADDAARTRFVDAAWPRVDAALTKLGA